MTAGDFGWRKKIGLQQMQLQSLYEMSFCCKNYKGEDLYV